MNIYQYRLTLTTEGTQSGPDYSVYYTTGSTYFPAIVGSTVNLPDVGSYVGITVPSASYIALKIVDNGVFCGNQINLVLTGSAPSTNSGSIYMNSFVDYPYGYADASTACSLGGYTGVVETVYWVGTIGNNTALYFDSSFTNAFDADGSFGWYWLNNYRFQYAGGISSYASC